MSDFYQTGVVTTLHRLGRKSLEAVEADLIRYTDQRRVALVLPCLIGELERPALKYILKELSAVKYIDQIVISLGLANEEQFRHACEYFSVLRQPYRIIWNEGPRLQALYGSLERSGLSIGENGKGRACFQFVGSGHMNLRDLSGLPPKELRRKSYRGLVQQFDAVPGKRVRARLGNRMLVIGSPSFLASEALKRCSS